MTWWNLMRRRPHASRPALSGQRAPASRPEAQAPPLPQTAGPVASWGTRTAGLPRDFTSRVDSNGAEWPDVPDRFALWTPTGVEWLDIEPDVRECVAAKHPTRIERLRTRASRLVNRRRD